MQALQELAFIVNKHKLRNIELAANFSTNQTKMAEFYNGLLENKFRNDDEAAQFFYETNRRNSNYQKLKSNLRRRLINSLFFIDVKQPYYADRQRAYYESYREWAAAKILMGKNARKAGIALCHKILKEAKKYEFNDLVMDITRTLRLHYGYSQGNAKKFEYFHEMYQEYEKIYLEENKAEELYVKLIIKYVNNRAQKDEVHQKALEYYRELEPILARNQSYRAHLYGNLIRFAAFTSVNDYDATIKACHETIEAFRAKPYLAKVPLQICYFQLLVCYTQIKQFEKGKEAAELCLDQLEEGNFNWFAYHQNYFFLSMHTKNYAEAYRILSKVKRHKRYKFLPSNTQEVWKIFEAYMHYLISIGKLDLSEVDPKPRKFSVNRFLNDTPIFSKDKRGLNIPILIAQILFLIHQKKYDMVIDRIDAIERYCTRYLRKDDTFRSNCFIKMLLQIPVSGFHKNGVQRRANRYYKELLANPLELSSQSHDIEIIPYEDLWELALNSLDAKFYKHATV